MAPLIFFICVMGIACLIGSLMEKSGAKNKILQEQNEKVELMTKVEDFRSSRRTKLKLEPPARLEGHYPLYFEPLNKIIVKHQLADHVINQFETKLEYGEKYGFFVPKEGATEKTFYNELRKYFPNVVQTEQQIGRYYPDIILYVENQKFGICIEIDERYTVINSTAKYIHYNEHLPSGRTTSLQRDGWYVLRFTDLQIKNQLTDCCYYVAKLATYISTDYVFVNAFKNVAKKAVEFDKVYCK